VNWMSHITLACGLVALIVAADATAAAAAPIDPAAVYAKDIARGRYLVKIAGCNDCHTAGYAEHGGKMPETQWLLGNRLGWRGPWGTTYATNLRLLLNSMGEHQWVGYARKLETRPPMPWFNLNQLREYDLRAIYRFVQHLGPAGIPAPAYLPPGVEAKTAVVKFPE
jgi:mono/diheme cytochrome c family protein